MSDLTMSEIKKLTVKELRTYVRDEGLASGVAVAMAIKENLLALISGDIDSLKEAPSSQDLAAFEDDIRADNEEKGIEIVIEAKPIKKKAPKKVTAPSTDLADVLAAALSGKIEAGMDEDRVIELIKEHGKITKEVKHIHLKDAPVVELEERTHKAFEKILKLVSLGLPVLLVGPAGTGKTTLAGQVAKALDRRFSYNSMSAGCSESHLIGRTLPDSSGNWNYKPSPFVTTYKDGGVHLFDEIDAADPNLMVIINSALANGHLSIPFEDMVIDRNKDTAIIAAANTFGTGANRQYIGRNALDAATLDRFSVSTVEIGYDEELESALVNEILGDYEGTKLLNDCVAIRTNIETSGLRRIMSTRTMVNIAKRMAAGDTIQDCLESFFAGWSADELKRVGR